MPPVRKSEAHRRKGPLRDPILDDATDFAAVDKALSNLGVAPVDRLAIYTAVAAVLHLGNVSFEDNPDDVKGQAPPTGKGWEDPGRE